VAVTALAALAVAAQQPAATAATYSNIPTAPTTVTVDALGQYIFEGRVAGDYDNSGGSSSSTKCLNETNTRINCADYIKISIPSGFAISRINLDYYDSTDDRAFIGFQSGAQFNIEGFDGTDLLAYNHFGWRGLCATTYGDLRLANTNNPQPPSATYNCTNGANTEPVSTPTTTNLLTQVLASSPIPGYLGSGDYTFWIQQVSGDSSYQFTVQSVQQTPAPLPVIGAAAAFGWSRRLRRRLRSTSLG
jgi:hypothetical protein